jgi:hypothetical protein
MKKLFTLFAAAFVLCTSFPTYADEPVTISANPSRAILGSPRDRAYLSVIIRVKPDINNRNLIFESDSEDGEYVRKDIALDGEESPRTFDISNRYFGKNRFSLTAGHYKLRATVESSDGKQHTSTIEVTITLVGETGEEGP